MVAGISNRLLQIVIITRSWSLHENETTVTEILDYGREYNAGNVRKFLKTFAHSI